MKTHGMKNTREWRAWSAMRYRCNVKTCPVYSRYGGRGITVAPNWDKSFEEFYRDMGACPSGMTLDRIDNDGPYSRGNCRWATYQDNLRNRTRRTGGGFNVFAELRGERLCLAAWADGAVVSKSAFYKRVRAGWPLEKALNTPRSDSRKPVQMEIP